MPPAGGGLRGRPPPTSAGSDRLPKISKPPKFLSRREISMTAPLFNFLRCSISKYTISMQKSKFSASYMQKSKYFRPFLVFGVNPLFAYVFAELWASIISGVIKFQFEGSMFSLKSWVFSEIFAPLFGNMNGSLTYSIFVMFFYWSILWLMDKYKIYIKI